MSDQPDAKPNVSQSLPPAIVRPKPKRLRTALGLVFTALYLLWAAYYVGWGADLVSMEADKLASFLAGIFSPLAFLWLVLGFFQQGDELRQSADALWLQGEELRNSVEQQRQLVKTQREAIRFEQDRLDQDRLEEHRQAQPDLIFISGGHSSGIDGHVCDLGIINRGADCTDLRVEVLDTVVREHRVARGQSVSFKVRVPKNAPTGIMMVDAVFFDARNQPGSQKMPLDAYKSGDYTVFGPIDM